MNNTKEPIKGSKLEGKQSNNEKKETSVDVEVIPDLVSTLSIDSKDIFNMENMGKTENICKEVVIYTEEDETRNTVLVADDVNNQRKTPKVWVQYNQSMLFFIDAVFICLYKSFDICSSNIQKNLS